MSTRSQSEFPPWMTQKKAKTDSPKREDPLLFHQEIMGFVRYIKLNSEEKEQRIAVVESLSKVITKLYPQARVDVYGSFETDLCLPQSDIDVVVFGTGMSTDEPNLSALFGLSEAIMASGLAKSMPTVISSARVPIIKFQEETTGVMVDVSFECVSALATTEIIKNYCKRYPMLRPLTVVIKYYLKQRYLNETWSGGIGSYTLVVMVLSFLQMQTVTGGRTRRTEEGEDLSTLLLQFLQFYGTQFDYFHNVISVINGGSYLRKEDKNWSSNAAPDALSIEDPTNPEMDLAAGAYRIQDARAVFMEGFWRLTHESPRWAHTHSFLARLFDHGPLPEGFDPSAISSTSISPRGPHTADSQAKASISAKQSSSPDSNGNIQNDAPDSPPSHRQPNANGTSPRSHLNQNLLRSSSELAHENGNSNNSSNTHGSHSNGHSRGYHQHHQQNHHNGHHHQAHNHQHTSNHENTQLQLQNEYSSTQPHQEKQNQQKTPTKKKQQHRHPQRSPNGPNSTQQNGDQKSHSKAHHQGHQDHHNTHQTHNGHQNTHHNGNSHGQSSRGPRKTPSNSPKKNGSVSPRRPADAHHNGGDVLKLDPSAPEYHPVMSTLPPKPTSD